MGSDLAPVRARSRTLARALACFAVAACLLARSAAAGAPAPAAEATAAFKAGFAERDITPDVGMEQPGNYGKNFAGPAHDPCKVRAAVFDDGTTRVALVGIDALGVRADTVRNAREAIQERCGIEPGAVMVAASHSHSAGPTVGALPGEWDGASDLVKSLVYERSTNADPKYLARVEQAIADAVVEAHERRVEADCAAGFGVAEGVAFNRRFRMKDGRSVTHPRQMNPDTVEPAGPADPQVGVLGAWDAKDGKFLGCVVNFACHATTGPGGTSADYVTYVEQTIRGLMGDDAVTVFMPGASGDVTQVDNRSPYAVPHFGERATRLLGGTVGAEAVKVLLSLQDDAGPLGPVAAKNEVLRIERRPPKPERVAAALELVQKAPDAPGVDPTRWTFAKETVILAEIMKREPVADVEVQAIQVGPAVYLSCPAEYFCQFGLDLKADSKFPFTFPVSLANGCIGYVPTEDAFLPTGGGYETRLTSYSNLEPEAGRRIADALLALAAEMKPGPVPEPPRLPAEPRGETWPYGNNPPELE